jgi:eukaryotic-like serine/threonine-protein kinase
MEAAQNVLVAGYRLDRYELLCPIASGGMATVWLAQLRSKRGFEKLFAIKTIRTELLEDTRFQEMFLDEARIASGIQHPNVAQILDLGEQRDVLFIVMEWVDGDSLAKVRRLLSKRGQKLPLGVSLRILADACAGLHAAHELRDSHGEPLGIVHRDVSPQNVLVATSGTVKVIDFGIAKAQNRKQGETRTGVVKGKIQYMAPEQVKKGRTVDRRADIWSLGVCLHELVTGKTPSDGDDDVEVIRKLLADEAPGVASDLPEPIRRILDASIALDPDARYPTAAGMQRALEGALKELGEQVTGEDVASFLRTELPELAQVRRDVVSKALHGATERKAPGPSSPEEVAFAPTVVSERVPRTQADPAIALTKRKVRAEDSQPNSVSEESRVRASSPPDAEPISIPRSRAGLWALLLIAAAVAGGAIYGWPGLLPRLLGKPTQATAAPAAVQAQAQDARLAPVLAPPPSAPSGGAPPPRGVAAPLAASASAATGAALQPATSSGPAHRPPTNGAIPGLVESSARSASHSAAPLPALLPPSAWLPVPPPPSAAAAEPASAPARESAPAPAESSSEDLANPYNSNQ